MGTFTCGSSPNAQTTQFVYNADDELVAKKVGGVAKAHYAAGELFEKDASTGTTKKYYRFGGSLVAVRDSSLGLKYLHQDHLGSTSLQTTSGGAYEGHEFRGPFGQPLSSGGSLATDLKYTDQRSLEGSLGSLYHYRSRWYSPALGRFLQPDAIVPSLRDPQSLNRYAYVLNSPLRYTDPTGFAALGPRPGAGRGENYGGYDERDGGVWLGEWQHSAGGGVTFVPFRPVEGEELYRLFPELQRSPEQERRPGDEDVNECFPHPAVWCWNMPGLKEGQAVLRGVDGKPVLVWVLHAELPGRDPGGNPGRGQDSEEDLFRRGPRFTRDQDALIQLAKEAERRGRPLTEEESRILRE